MLFGSKGTPINFFYEQGGRRFYEPPALSRGGAPSQGTL